MIDLNDPTPFNKSADERALELKLPPLPPIDSHDCIGYDHIRYVPGYTDEYVKSYAINYVRQVLRFFDFETLQEKAWAYDELCR